MKAILDWGSGALFVLTMLASFFTGAYVQYSYVKERPVLGYIEISKKPYKLVPAEVAPIPATQQACPVDGGESCN